jgi:hypothetical protein
MALSVGEIEATLVLRDQLSSEVKKISGTLGGFQSTLMKMGGALAAAFSVQAITSAVTSFTDLSGKLTDLAAKTGISTTELQKLKYAAELSGGSLETVTKAVGIMARNLVEGDKSAVGAMKRLGLNIMEIRQMQPGQAFAAISDAIAKIPSPMEQSTLAMQLFGKSGAELLPMIKGNMNEVMQAAERLGIVMDEETVAAGDRLGDTFTTLSAVGQGVLGKILGPMVPALQMVADAMTGLGDVVAWLQGAFQTLIKWGIQALKFFIDAGVKVTEFASSIPLLGKTMRDVDKTALESAKAWSVWFDDMAKGMDVVVPKATKQTNTLKTAVGLLTKEQQKGSKAISEHARELKKLADEDIKRIIDSYNDFAKNLRDLRVVAVGVPSALAEVGRVGAVSIEKIEDAWDDYGKAVKIATTVTAGLGKEFQNIGEHVDVQEPKLRSWMDDAIDRADLLANALSMIGRSIGGGIGAAIAGIGQLSSGMGDMIAKTQALIKSGDKSFGAMANNAIGWATFVVGYMQTAVALVESFYDDLSGKEFRDAMAARGGADEFVNQIRLAGAAFRGFSDDASEFRFQLSQLDQIVANNQRRMEAYGLTWRDLREDLRQVQIDHMTRTLRNDFRELERQLGSSQKAVEAMGDALSNLVVEAIRTGTKIPIALKPMIEQLIKAGKLTEEAAAAMLGLSREATPGWEDIRAAAERYGIELDRLGPKVEQIRIMDLGKRLAEDFELFSLAGADLNTVLEGMKGQVQNVVTAALRLGLEIPESMRPLIEALIRAGLLTDEFGNILTDTSRLDFATPLAERFDDLLAKLDELIDAFSKVGDAAEEGFGRARGAAAATGTAIPRGAPSPGGIPPPNSGPVTGRLPPDGAVPDPNDPRFRERTLLVINLDGRQIAEATVPHLPDVVESLGAYA